MLIAAEHPLVMELVKGKPREKEVAEFVDKIKKQDKLMRTSDYYEKEGAFLDSYCLNPVTGMKMPIYAANFVLADYGTGCVMAVPTHDQRDFEFAKKYNLPLIVVIQNPDEPLDAGDHDRSVRRRRHPDQFRPVQRHGEHEGADAIADYLESQSANSTGAVWRPSVPSTPSRACEACSLAMKSTPSLSRS